MSTLFDDTSFNEDISAWTSSVTTMNRARHLSHFNQDIGDWDVSSVTNMDRMFYIATAFNQDIETGITTSQT